MGEREGGTATTLRTKRIVTKNGKTDHLKNAWGNQKYELAPSVTTGQGDKMGGWIGGGPKPGLRKGRRKRRKSRG